MSVFLFKKSLMIYSKFCDKTKDGRKKNKAGTKSNSKFFYLNFFGRPKKSEKSDNHRFFIHRLKKIFFFYNFFLYFE